MQKSFKPTWSNLFFVIVVVTVAWSVSSVGYYEIAGALDLSTGYNEAPVLFSLYYGAWSVLVAVVFGPAIGGWSKNAGPGEDHGALAMLLMAFGFFALLVLPQLPQVEIPPGLNVADIVSAEPWYFVPKTVEIVFQQILLTALVLVLWAQNLTMRQLSILIAALFGGFHLTLALTDATTFYVFRYTIAATIFGALVPYLLLKLRNGFVYSFGIHWAFYAVDATLGHFAFAAT